MHPSIGCAAHDALVNIEANRITTPRTWGSIWYVVSEVTRRLKLVRFNFFDFLQFYYFFSTLRLQVFKDDPTVALWTLDATANPLRRYPPRKITVPAGAFDDAAAERSPSTTPWRRSGD
ncbi:MAG TPA: hypothetical protein EYG03_05285 [Planctomycetes bacterium]|nr:hypothetical protein [Fuerstiella sp.]HIK91385.1 hypothetical protein [Planctomycetota bacterium]